MKKQWVCLTWGILVLAGLSCEGPSGEAGYDGGAAVRFQVPNNDVQNLDTTLLVDDSFTYQEVGNDCLQSDYYGVINLKGAISWETLDGQKWTQSFNLEVEKGTPGGEWKPPRDLGDFYRNPDGHPGGDGDDGRHTLYIIEIVGSQVNTINNGFLKFPERIRQECPELAQTVKDKENL